MAKKNKNILKIVDLIDSLKLGRNVKKKDLELVVQAFPRAIKRLLMEKTELCLTGFLRIGFRLKQDCITRNHSTGETFHMPAHKRVKFEFYPECKKFLNS